MAESVLRQKLAHMCRQVGLEHGVVIRGAGSLTPLQIESAAKGSDFSRGVLACVAQVVYLLDQAPDGGQPAPDLFLEPVLQDVERPGCGGRDD